MRDIHPVMAVPALALVATAAFFCSGALSFGSLAHADPKPGLWQESVTQADGVTIRKIRDTTGGEATVCYVASKIFPSTYGGPDHASVAISCIPEKKP